MALSFAVGVASSMLGIGGGIIHVPAMVNLLDFPVHIATATSHFILTAMSLTATVMHVIDGALGWEELPRVLAIAAGAVVGAQIGRGCPNAFTGDGSCGAWPQPWRWSASES